MILKNIPINGNRNAALWGEMGDTPITYALRLPRNRPIESERMANLVRLLHHKCGVAVSGEGSGHENPLSLCIRTNNVVAARVLLQETDACYDPDTAIYQNELSHMIQHGQTEMLALFSQFKARTFPHAAQYLNGFGGRAANQIPLFNAALNNDVECVQILIEEFGADPYVLDDRQRRLLDIINSGTPEGREIRRLLQPKEILHALTMSQHPRATVPGETGLANQSRETLQKIISFTKLRPPT
jgi:hypothetical protein